MIHDDLICAKHKIYGRWYYTNRKKIEKTLKINQALFDYYMDKAKRNGKKSWDIRDWNFSWVENGDNVKYKYINPEKEDIFVDDYERS